MSAYNFYQIGGMNRNLNPFQVNTSDLKLCKNYRTSTFFTKEKRNGYSTYTPLGTWLSQNDGKVWNLAFWKQSNNTKWVFRIGGTTIRDNGGFTSTNWGSVANQLQIVQSDTTVTGSTQTAVIDAATEGRAQPIKVDTTGTYPTLYILVKKVGAPGYSLRVEIQTDNSGKPSGTEVTNATKDIADTEITTSYAWYRIDFATAPTLTANTLYWITFMPTGSGTLDGSNYFQLGHSGGAAGYLYGGASLGTPPYTADSGSTWSTSGISFNAFCFILYLRTGCLTSHCLMDNGVFFTNGGNLPIVFRGSGYQSLPLAPPGKYSVALVNRVWVAGVDYAPSRLYYSKVNDYSSWANDAADKTTGGYVDIDPDNGGKIIALTQRNSRVYVHKEFARYKVLLDEYGIPSEVINMEIDEPTSSHFSIITSGDYGYYINKTGIFREQGGQPELISLPLGDLMRNCSATSLNSAISGKIKDDILFGVGDVTEDSIMGGRTFTNCLFVYNKRVEEWYLYTLANAPTALCTIQNSDDTMSLIFGTAAGTTYIFDTTLADGSTPIEGELQWFPQYFGDPAASKLFNSLYVYSAPGVTSNFFVKADDSDEVGIGDLQSGYIDYSFLEEMQDARSLSFSIRDNSSSAISRIHGFTVDLQMGKRRSN